MVSKVLAALVLGLALSFIYFLLYELSMRFDFKKMIRYGIWVYFVTFFIRFVVFGLLLFFAVKTGLAKSGFTLIGLLAGFVLYYLTLFLRRKND